MGFALRPPATRRKVGGFSFSCHCLRYPCNTTAQPEPRVQLCCLGLGLTLPTANGACRQGPL